MADITTKSIADRRHELEDRLKTIRIDLDAYETALKIMKCERAELEGEVAYAEEALERAEKKLEGFEDEWSRVLSERDAADLQESEVEDELDLLKEVGN